MQDEEARESGSGGSPAVQLRAQPSSNLVLLVLSGAALLIGVMFAVFILQGDPTVGRGISLAVFLGVLAASLAAIHHVRSTTYLVTQDAAVAQTGLLEDRTERLALDEVASIEVGEPGYKRLFGMGDVRLEPASPDEGSIRFASVSDPRALRASLLQLVEGPSGDDRAPSSASATHSSSGSSRA